MATITIEKASLAQALGIVTRTVATRATLPILSNILIKAEGGQLELASTNLEVGITLQIEAKTDASAATTLPARILSDLVNTLGDPEVSLHLNGTPDADLRCGPVKATLKGLDAADYPSMPGWISTSGSTLDASAFREMLHQVTFAASSDTSRPVLNGVLLEMDGRRLTLAATDGFRLTLCQHEFVQALTDKPRKLIIPASALKELVRLIGIEEEPVDLVLPKSGSQIIFQHGRLQVISQLVDGNFPDYQMILPKSHKTKITVSTEGLLKACKQAEIIARDGQNVVILKAEDEELRVSASAEETGLSESHLPARIEGDALEIAFNVRFLREFLSVVKSPEVVLQGNSHKTPMTLSPSGSSNYQYILMPVHVG
jgi:DNA polymerase-3 subunit beta